MLSIVYGLISALTWGTGDFGGGLASRRMGAYRATFYGEASGLVMLLAAVALVGGPLLSPVSWAWCATAGISGALGLLLFYRALAAGPMSVAAPVSALTAAALPVVFSALTEGLPAVTKYLGFALALVSIWMISQEPGNRRQFHVHLADLRLPLISGIFFGVYFILIHQGSREATLWPLIAARITGSLVLFLVALTQRQAGPPQLHHWPVVILNAVGDIGGNTFYILAAQTGRLDVAAVLGSLYPGTTVLLAGLFLHERLSRLQWIGVAAALGAILLMTL